MKHLQAPRLRASALAALLAGSALLLGGCASKSLYPNAAQNQAASEALAADTGDAARGADAAPNPAQARARHLQLIEQMQQKGLWFASLAHIDALERVPGGASALSQRLRADALRHTGQATEAEAAYGRLLGTPLAAAGLRGLGLLAGEKGDYAAAAAFFQRAQKEAPTDAAVLSDLGYALLRLGRVADARVPMLQAAQLSPDSAQIQTNVALYLLMDGQADSARALMAAQRMSAATRDAVERMATEFASTARPSAATSPAPVALAAVSSGDTPPRAGASR